MDVSPHIPIVDSRLSQKIFCKPMLAADPYFNIFPDRGDRLLNIKHTLVLLILLIFLIRYLLYCRLDIWNKLPDQSREL